MRCAERLCTLNVNSNPDDLCDEYLLRADKKIQVGPDCMRCDSSVSCFSALPNLPNSKDARFHRMLSSVPPKHAWKLMNTLTMGGCVGRPSSRGNYFLILWHFFSHSTMRRYSDVGGSAASFVSTAQALQELSTK
jgi:hypothetical protein